MTHISVQFTFQVRKLFSTLCFFLLFTGIATAQKSDSKGDGTISGRITDSASGQPVVYASISLTSPDGKKEMNGTTSDDNGLFKLNKIAEGTYRIVIYFVGYQTGFRNNVTINSTNSNIAMGDIKLVNKTVLKQVNITAERSLIENKIDKIVYNAENDVTSQGGVATDVLKKVPEVSVDIDGNVEIQGNSNIRFLINGKPSSMFGSNLVDVLQSIPASQIKSIEVITSPGAKYDAEGTGGIINIILKKSTAQGINGNVSLSGGTRLENGSLNLNAKKGSLGAHAFFSGNAQLQSTVLSDVSRTSVDPLTLQQTITDQNGTSKFERNGYQTGFGADWEITSNDLLSGGVLFNYFGNTNTGNMLRTSLSQDATGASLSNITDLLATQNNAHGQVFDWHLDYKHSFKKEGQELSALVNSSSGTNYSYYSQSQTHQSNDSLFNASNGTNPGTDKETEISVDYAQPLGKESLLETGAKTTLNDINSASNVYLLNSNTSNYDFSNSQSLSFHYKREIYAGYGSLKFKLFDYLDVKLGCRYEYTEHSATYSNSGGITFPSYGTVVPSAAFSHAFKNNQTLKLLYSHRIQRPDYRDLNPFLNASDPQNITGGNVNLRPEISNRIELGYNKSFEKGGSFSLTLFARMNTDDIQPYTRYYSVYPVGDSTYKNVTVSIRDNIGHENNYGMSIFANVPVTSKISIRTNISGFERYITTGLNSGGDIHGFNYRVNVNATWQVSGTLALEAFGNFNSPHINAQGTMPSQTTYTFAFRKQFDNKKASVAITATNPFSEYVDQKSNLTGTNFMLVTDRQLPYRSFGINLTYKFGKMEFKKQKDQEENNLPDPSLPGTQ
jgi:ferric enterobactin receptor